MASQNFRKRKQIENDRSDDKKINLPEVALTDLPEIAILLIASHLTGKDLLNFSHLCRKFYQLCDTSTVLWKKVLINEGLTFSETIRNRAKLKADVGQRNVNVDKISYFLHLNTKKNWMEGHPLKTITLPALEGHPDLSHQDGDIIIGISAYQSLDEASYNFNIWNPGTNTLKSILWNTEIGIKMIEELYTRLFNWSVHVITTNDVIVVVQFRPLLVSLSSVNLLLAIKLDIENSKLQDLWQLEVTSTSCDRMFYTPKALFQIISTNEKTISIEIISTESGENKFIFKSPQSVGEFYPGIYDENFVVFAWKTEFGESQIIVIEKETGNYKFLNNPDGDFNQLQDLTIRSGKVLILKSNGISLLFDGVTGKLIERILTKPTTAQLCNKIVNFDPLRSQFTLSIVSYRTSLITYKGKHLRNFKVSSSQSVTYNDMKLAKTPDQSISVVHNLFIRCFPEKTDQLYFSILAVNKNQTARNVQIMKGFWAKEFVDFNSKFTVSGNLAIIATRSNIHVFDFSSSF